MAVSRRRHKRPERDGQGRRTPELSEAVEREVEKVVAYANALNETGVKFTVSPVRDRFGNVTGHAFDIEYGEAPDRAPGTPGGARSPDEVAEADIAAGRVVRRFKVYCEDRQSHTRFAEDTLASDSPNHISSDKDILRRILETWETKSETVLYILEYAPGHSFEEMGELSQQDPEAFRALTRVFYVRPGGKLSLRGSGGEPDRS
jgi:hypothetical protein